MSIIATAVKHLLAAGVTGDALIAAIADMEANQSPSVDAVAEKRRAYDRERKRNARNSGGSPVETADIAETTPFPAPPNENNLTPPTHTPVNKTRARKETPFPDDWEPILTPEAQQVVDGWPPGMFQRQLASFRDHAADKGRKSKDWQAAFRTWINKADEWKPKNGTANRTGSADRRSSLARAIDEGLGFLG